MRLQLTLTPCAGHSLLPVNYQYPLSAAIYRIIQQADEKYSTFLHDQGYKLNGKSFKLFCFSDLRVPFRIQGDRLHINGSPASLTISFHVDEAATNFIRGIFINQQFEIADKISRTQFSVTHVQLLPNSFASIHHTEPEMVLQPLSPLVVGRKNNKGNYDFLSPADPDFNEWFIHNWIEKYKTINGSATVDVETIRNRISIQLLTPGAEIKSRLITIKAFTTEQTQIRGFTKFRMKVKASKLLLELAMNAGLGLYNAQGLGCMEVSEIIS
ncbi:CRISPR-associated endoribonuclease Cas6 [Niastella koreensis]|uniref:CRISPR-associated protein Cas6 n=2 Tax=Niastella koreensis TaxID=354356 RepID=G8TRE8_NIAKG|nr:CRISPR-associated endoribonuclease Cas6 [Niastella koreensis]AEW01079.1 CRISPR-associated protein Cas6 [Niastella koreensis GR20-10]OQP41800.1 CRISPR-associated endoribonuclease Cas6 [Niastella koreensis]